MYPTEGAGHVANQFSNGNPGAGIRATNVEQDWLNRVQNELLNVLVAAGITPSKASDAQVAAAIAVIAKAAILASDGAGSGYDADLLDGLHASAFAQLSGATFSGPVRRDGFFYFDLAPNPIINFDANDYLFYNRTSNRWDFAVGDVGQFAILSSGIVSARVGFDAGGNVVWHAANDGLGSGLDADTTRGYVPANKAGDTFTGPFGRDSLFFFNLASGNPAVVLDSNDFLLYDRAANSFNLAIGNVTQFTVDAGGVFDARAGFTVSGATVWGAHNDGPGSTLDADTVDGWELAAILTEIDNRIATALANFVTFTANGNGNAVQIGPFVMNWGRSSITTGDTDVTHGMAVAFPNAALGSVVGTRASSVQVNATVFAYQAGDVTQTAIDLVNQSINSPQPIEADFLAFGR
jgi:hypothetical protein